MPKRKRDNDLGWLSKIKVEDFLETLGVRNITQARADELKYSCPFSGHNHGDENPSAYMNTGDTEPDRATMFLCHGCGRKGNAISFLAEHQNITKYEAAVWLRREYASDYRSPKGGSISAEFEQRREKLEEKKKATVEPEFIDRKWLTEFHVPWQHVQDDPRAAYLLERGFSPDILESWQIGYDAHSKRWAIPIRDHLGHLVGFKGRNETDRKPKYLALGGRGYGFSTYEKSHYVFGLDRAKRYEGQTAIIVEGELNVIALDQLGFHNAIGISGSSMSDKQAKLIRDHFDKAWIFLDWDAAGHAATWGWTSGDGTEHRGIVDLLEPHIRLYIVGEHEGDPADMMRLGKGNDVERLLDEAKISTSYVAIPDEAML